MRPIQDEFTDLPLSTTRKKQLRWKRDGRCIRCGQPRVPASPSLCLRHWQLIESAKTIKKEQREQRKIQRYQDQKRAFESGQITPSEIERRKSLTIPLPIIGRWQYRTKRNWHT